MKIKEIKTRIIKIPLIKPFKTALRELYVAEMVVVELVTDSGLIGFGSAPPTAVITGDTLQSILCGIHDFIGPAIMDIPLDEFETIQNKMHRSILRNTSAKAAVDMALYDLIAKKMDLPLYQYLGGSKNKLESDVTISVNAPEQMANDAAFYKSQGYRLLKVKVGTNLETDIKRVNAIKSIAGNDIKIRIDANQGYTPKEAIRFIKKIEDLGIDPEFVEQPVHALDINGLKIVKDSVDTPIMADESLFSPEDAIKLIKSECVDLFNIKLMKSGGIYQALKINAIAESAGIQCMVGCMIENNIGISAVAHFAMAKSNITRVDLDSAVLLSENPIIGGVEQIYNMIKPSHLIGLGVEGLMEGNHDIR